ncbi:sensor histidine kinase [Kitasatospora sp. MAP5-34]|uniref:sensor histidine kinase n=1 Tax=Kitasatospora sp. MAP5-34 TaxID=3035102 RepID=UPI002476A5A7|nr:sensor histidine kinase [Kitasatospora sp. MAP5-34]MDH6579320.1 signal transduction histidine kinase [Kitasatospora sp. MAP5-34]
MAMRRPLPPDAPHGPNAPRTPQAPQAPDEPGADSPWTRNDALVAAGSAVMDLFGYAMTSLDDNRPPGLLGLVLCVVTALPLPVRHRHPLAVLAGVLAGNLVLNLSAPLSHHFPCTTAVALFAVTRHRPLAVAVPAGLTAALVAVTSRGPRLSLNGADLLGGLLASVLVVGTGAVLNRWQREVEARRRLLAERAVAEERRRIARELHDIVAHHITTMQLMAGGARANLGGDTEVVREALMTLESSGRLALREMRQLLDVLRADDEREVIPAAPQPGTADLERIVDESRLAGLPTEFTVHGTARPLPPTTDLAVFRIVQESLTNARKHAGPASARVELTYRPQSVTVKVSDNGSGRSHGHSGAVATPGSGRQRGGYGLIGMRERAALHGGSLAAGPLAEGGFRVAASLPLGPAESVDGEELPLTSPGRSS